MPFDASRALAHLDEHGEESVERLKALLRIPSISTDSQYDADTRKAAEWLANELAELGFDASVRDTSGHPMVVAHHEGPGEGAPRLMYYGHYDVQPPDPVAKWTTPPFEPTVVEGEHGPRIVARGAVDDKGQLMTFVEAFRAIKATHGSMPAAITVLLEGEEESGSPSLDPFLKANRDELQADVCVVCDTGMWDLHTPAITTMLRGLLYLEATLRGPSHDLHSGMYGGAVLNPLNAITEIVGQLHDANGRVQIPGFYDDVRDVEPETKKQWDSLNFDETRFLASAGLKNPHGERGFSTLERVWARPTCDINGLIGGYTGEGAKTVIGAEATAKISCRLVADQDPKKIEASLKDFLRERTPKDGEWEFHLHGGSPAIKVDADSPHVVAARKGLDRIFRNDAVLIGCGGSIPVVGSIQSILGFDSLLVGFGLEDDRVHSPNEKFELKCYHDGAKAHVTILDELTRGGAPS